MGEDKGNNEVRRQNFRQVTKSARVTSSFPHLLLPTRWSQTVNNIDGIYYYTYNTSYEALSLQVERQTEPKTWKIRFARSSNQLNSGHL